MNSVYSFLGLAHKAGQLAIGADAVEAAIRRHKAKSVIITADCSARTARRFKSLCANYRVRCTVFGKSHQLGVALGRRATAVAAVLDGNFAKRLTELIVDRQESGGERY